MEVLLKVLDRRSIYVLQQHYWNGASYQEIAADLGVSTARIEQLVRAALTRLRRHIIRSHPEMYEAAK
jgi:DNA-directed RNA polymerase sigma subunit (sigma70/sigma32)